MSAADAQPVSSDPTSAASTRSPAPVLPLSGLRVVEIGRFASAPSCATVLADWGASVVKVEPLTGDPARGTGLLPGTDVSPRFDLHNQSRRSLALDLQEPEGYLVARKLIGSADALVTNLRAGSLQRLGLDPRALRAEHPALVVAHISGYGTDTSLGEERSYDHGAFWSFAGVASMFTAEHGEPPQPSGGFGDRAAGSMMAGAVCAALLGVQRTGTGAYLSTSLVSTGLWLMASDLSDEIASPGRPRSQDRRRAPIPTLNPFRTADGRWLWLQVMLPEQDWPRLVAALGAPWLDEDPRFRGGGLAKLTAARDVVVETLDEIFRRRTLAWWGERLTAHGLAWAPVRSLGEVAEDPELRESSAFTQVIDGNGQVRLTVNTPIAFRDMPPRLRTGAPSAGEHSIEILEELGYDAAEIARLREHGIVGGAVPPAPFQEDPSRRERRQSL